MKKGDKIFFGEHYLANLPDYQMHADFINGKPRRVSKYLIKAMSEYAKALVEVGGPPVAENATKISSTKVENVGDAAYKQRVERLFNNNFCETILWGWIANLTKEITRSKPLTIKKSEWPKLLSNVDGMKTPLDIFARDLLWDYCGLGFAGVLIEGTSEVSLTAEKAKANNERSYCTIFEARNILSYTRDTSLGPRRGQLTSLLLREGPGDQEDTMIVKYFWLEVEPGEKEGEVQTRYSCQRFKLKTPDVLRKVDGNTSAATLLEEHKKGVDYEPLDSPEKGDLPEIPFVLIGSGPEDSVIKNTVDKNREHLNKKSKFDTINENQAFKKLAGIGVKEKEILYWSHNIMALIANPDAKIQEILPGDPASLERDIERLERDIFLEGFMRHKLRYQKATGQVQAADSKRQDNDMYEEYLNNIADLGEAALNEMLRFMWLFERSEEPAEGKVNVKISRNFDTELTLQEVASRNLLYQQSGDFGEVGEEIKAEIVASALGEFRFAASDRDQEDEMRTRLIEGVREAAKAGLVTSRLRASEDEKGSITDRIDQNSGRQDNT